MRKPQLTKARTRTIIVLSIIAALVCIAIAPEIRPNESAVDAWTLLHIATNLMMGIAFAFLFTYYRRICVFTTMIWFTLQVLVWLGILGIIGWEIFEQGYLNHIWSDAGESMLNTVTDIFIGLAVFLVSFGWMLHRLRSEQRRR